MVVHHAVGAVRRVAFAAVAEERSFTRAAAKLGTSQSALSFTVRRLERRYGKALVREAYEAERAVLGTA